MIVWAVRVTLRWMAIACPQIAIRPSRPTATGAISAASIAATPLSSRSQRKKATNPASRIDRAPYCSFWKTWVELMNSVPFARSLKTRPSGPATTGHWYITLRIMSCPGEPGL